MDHLRNKIQIYVKALVNLDILKKNIEQGWCTTEFSKSTVSPQWIILERKFQYFCIYCLVQAITA